MPIVNYDWDELEDNIVEEYDDAGVTIADYTTEPDHFGNVISQHRSDQSSFFHYDGQGSTLAVTDESQAVTDTRAYSAFGETTETSGSTDFRFEYIGESGYLRATTTEYDARRRTYGPAANRWLNTDPIGISLHSPNPYIYASGAPTRLTDPSGLDPCDCDPAIGLGLGPGYPWELYWPPSVVRDLVPSDPGALSGFPYYLADLDAAGVTSGAETLSCRCGSCSWLPSQQSVCYEVTCKLSGRYFITIDNKILRPDRVFLGRRGGRYTIANAYGHEQRHVRNRVTYMLQISADLEQILSKVRCQLSNRAECITLAATIETRGNDRISVMRERDNMHVLYPEPEAKTPYDPIGTIPPRPAGSR